MSNYVHNYVFCSQEAFESFRLLNDEVHLISASYEYFFYRVNTDSYLLIFDTRGMEYNKAFIELFIYKFRDTKWFCVEENEVEEGCFCWNNDRVELVVRPLYESDIRKYTDDDILIQFELASYKPILTILITEKEMIIEHILHDKATNYSLSEFSTKLVWKYVEGIMKSNKYRLCGRDTIYEFATKEINNLQREVQIDWINHTVNINVSNYDEKDNWQEDVQNGDIVFGDALKLVKAIIQQEKGKEDFEIEKSIINNALERVDNWGKI